MMKKTVILCVVWSIALCGLLQAGQLSEGLNVFYRSEGGKSSYSYIQVHVDKEGEVNVEWKKHNEDVRQGHFKLDSNEMDYVAAAIQSSDFFAEVTRLKREGKRSRVVCDAPTERLKVEWKWKKAELEFIDHEQFHVLTNVLNQLANQSILEYDLMHGGSLYDADVAVSPRAVGRKVFSPERLADVVKDCLVQATTHEQWASGLCALAWSMSDVEWQGYVAGLFDNVKWHMKKRKLLLQALFSHPCNLPSEKKKLLPALLTVFLENYAQDKREMDKELIGLLANACYFCSFIRPPLKEWTLKNLAERHPETYKMVEICLKNGLENKTVVEF